MRKHRLALLLLIVVFTGACKEAEFDLNKEPEWWFLFEDSSKPTKEEKKEELKQKHKDQIQEQPKPNRKDDFLLSDDSPCEMKRVKEAVQALGYVASIPDLASRLSTIATTEKQRAWGIYVWIASNITYDIETYLQIETRQGYLRTQNAGVVFSTKLGVCEGYSSLFVAVAEEMGMEAIKVHGNARTPLTRIIDEGKADHSWNAVKIDGKWCLLDVTWGSGGISDGKFVRQFNSFWFVTDPNSFVYSHLPQDPKWQLVGNPLSFNDFVKTPYKEVTNTGAFYDCKDAQEQSVKW